MQRTAYARHQCQSQHKQQPQHCTKWLPWLQGSSGTHPLPLYAAQAAVVALQDIATLAAGQFRRQPATLYAPLYTMLKVLHATSCARSCVQVAYDGKIAARLLILVAETSATGMQCMCRQRCRPADKLQSQAERHLGFGC